MIDIRKDYTSIQKPILYIIVAEFFIQLVANALLYILPLYMHVAKYTDGEIAQCVSYRFLGVVLTSIPLGFFIKGRKLKVFFTATGILMPLFTIVSLLAISYYNELLVDITQFFIGVFFSFFSVAILPYLIRNEKPEHQTSAISLHYIVIALGTVISGWMVGLLNELDKELFNERNVLILIAAIGFLNLYFLQKVKIDEQIPVEHKKKLHLLNDFDWKRVIYILLPCIFISLGAGLTVPFLGLFFVHVHNTGTGAFALMSSSSSVLIVLATLYIPYLKRTAGMRSSITWIQLLAVVALILMASTQYYNMYSIAIVIAVIAYFIRNSFMNMAGPLSSELSINYGGERNGEIISALMFAIAWGGYYVSAIAFKVLRNNNVDYASIFYITAFLYLLGTWLYYIIAGKHSRDIANSPS
ncbi:MAG TPA: MFS transporter [Bacteroidia bacterium]|nr:MFS transporter [Bacteroidia bacterium]